MKFNPVDKYFSQGTTKVSFNTAYFNVKVPDYGVPKTSVSITLTNRSASITCDLDAELVDPCSLLSYYSCNPFSTVPVSYQNGIPNAN